MYIYIYRERERDKERERERERLNNFNNFVYFLGRKATWYFYAYQHFFKLTFLYYKRAILILHGSSFIKWVMTTSMRIVTNAKVSLKNSNTRQHRRKDYILLIIQIITLSSRCWGVGEGLNHRYASIDRYLVRQNDVELLTCLLAEPKINSVNQESYCFWDVKYEKIV